MHPAQWNKVAGNNREERCPFFEGVEWEVHLLNRGQYMRSGANSVEQGGLREEWETGRNDVRLELKHAIADVLLNTRVGEN